MKHLIITLFVLCLSYKAGGQSQFETFEGIDEDEVGPSYNETDLSTVHYLLWTRSNSGDDEDYELLYEDPDSLMESPFDGSKRTYFAYHGWGGNPYDGWILQSKTSLLILSDCQVISVNYSVLAAPTNYDKAVYQMYDVANYTASFIDWLVSGTELVTSDIHIFGHSLGGQASGMTGHYVTTGTIDRVTGIDPAGPEFYTKLPSERLDQTSALFVDVIHSNGGTLDEECVGLFKAIGHSDFYPNGGKHQPGCVAKLDGATFCSHGKSTEFWAESIQETGDMLQFWSYECSDYDLYLNGSCFDASSSVMGYHTDRNLSGTFFLETNAQSPYAQGPQTGS